MIERRGEKVVLTTPITAEDLVNLRIGEIIYLDGDLVTCRDVVHRRLICGGRQLPVNLEGGAIFHAGPIVRPMADQEGNYEMVSVGPTTSMRMERFEKDFIASTGVKLVIGKGGMGADTAEGCRRYQAIHCVFPAGCAVLAATQVQRIAAHYWDELGMPETLWCCKVKEFGPLVISIDVTGQNLFEKNRETFKRKEEEALAEIKKQVSFIE